MLQLVYLSSMIHPSATADEPRCVKKTCRLMTATSKHIDECQSGERRADRSSVHVEIDPDVHPVVRDRRIHPRVVRAQELQDHKNM